MAEKKNRCCAGHVRVCMYVQSIPGLGRANCAEEDQASAAVAGLPAAHAWLNGAMLPSLASGHLSKPLSCRFLQRQTMIGSYCLGHHDARATCKLNGLMLLSLTPQHIGKPLSSLALALCQIIMSTISASVSSLHYQDGVYGLTACLPCWHKSISLSLHLVILYHEFAHHCKLTTKHEQFYAARPLRLL